MHSFTTFASLSYDILQLHHVYLNTLFLSLSRMWIILLLYIISLSYTQIKHTFSFTHYRSHTHIHTPTHPHTHTHPHPPTHIYSLSVILTFHHGYSNTFWLLLSLTFILSYVHSLLRSFSLTFILSLKHLFLSLFFLKLTFSSTLASPFRLFFITKETVMNEFNEKKQKLLKKRSCNNKNSDDESWVVAPRLKKNSSQTNFNCELWLQTAASLNGLIWLSLNRGLWGVSGLERASGFTMLYVPVPF